MPRPPLEERLAAPQGPRLMPVWFCPPHPPFGCHSPSPARKLGLAGGGVQHPPEIPSISPFLSPQFRHQHLSAAQQSRGHPSSAASPQRQRRRAASFAGPEQRRGPFTASLRGCGGAAPLQPPPPPPPPRASSKSIGLRQPGAGSACRGPGAAHSIAAAPCIRSPRGRSRPGEGWGQLSPPSEDTFSPRNWLAGTPRLWRRRRRRLSFPAVPWKTWGDQAGWAGGVPGTVPLQGACGILHPPRYSHWPPQVKRGRVHTCPPSPLLD